MNFGAKQRAKKHFLKTPKNFLRNGYYRFTSFPEEGFQANAYLRIQRQHCSHRCVLLASQGRIRVRLVSTIFLDNFHKTITSYSCADKLVLGQKTDGYITYVMKYVDLLLYHNIKPIMVFDGRNLPSKAETEKKRRENRSRHRKMAKDYLNEGKYKEARECFQRCIDITPEMAREVIVALQARNIDCIVAPYEADAQLAFLAKNGYVSLVISEDSDLTLFGCEKIIFKLDVNGNGTLVEMTKLNTCLGTKADQFTFEKFRYMCIMSGCDYLSSLHGIGLGKSMKFWSLVTNPDIRQVLTKIPSYLNMHHLQVNQDYIEGFIQANQTFLHQLVFDPKLRKLRPLNDYPAGLNANILPFCGELLNNQMALNIALGNIDLHTLKVVNDFNPDNGIGQTDSKPKYGKRAEHPSIWNAGFQPGQQISQEVKKVEDKVQALFSKAPKPESSLKKRKRSPSPPLVCTPEKVEEDEADTVFIYKSRFFKPKTEKPEPQKTQAGGWLEQLEESIDQNNYKNDNEEDDSAGHNSQKENSDKVLKQAFKPLATNQTMPRRNPFVKTTPSPKEIKAKVGPLKIDIQSLKTAPIVKESLISPERPPPNPKVLKEEKSHYFQPKSQPTKKPKGMSGLLKKGHGRQPNLFDMWTKKNT